MSALEARRGEPVVLPRDDESFVAGAIVALSTGEVCREVATEVMAAPHTVPLDVFGAVEIGRLTETLMRIDRELASGRKINTGLLAARDRVAMRLRVWLREYGLTPRGRIELIAMSERADA